MTVVTTVWGMHGIEIGCHLAIYTQSQCSVLLCVCIWRNEGYFKKEASPQSSDNPGPPMEPRLAPMEEALKFPLSLLPHSGTPEFHGHETAIPFHLVSTVLGYNRVWIFP